MKNFPYRVTASYLFVKFGKYLNEKDSIGQILADSRKGADHQLLKTFNLCKEGTIPLERSYLEAVKECVTAISFAEKGFLSGGLEVTDLISYISFLRYRRLLSSFSAANVQKVWGEISTKANVGQIGERTVRNYFGIKKGGVHKYLAS